MSSEAWLIRKAKKGDTEAYGELIQLHKDYFYRNAFCYVKNVDLAGDVFQEAVTIGMLSIKDLKNPNYFRTWMTRIIYNCANEMFRKAEKEIGSLVAISRALAVPHTGGICSSSPTITAFLAKENDAAAISGDVCPASSTTNKSI